MKDVKEYLNKPFLLNSIKQMYNKIIKNIKQEDKENINLLYKQMIKAITLYLNFSIIIII